MFCVMCRAENPDQGRYCWKCGSDLVKTSVASDPPRITPATTTQTEGPPYIQPAVGSPARIESGNVGAVAPEPAELPQLATTEMPPPPIILDVPQPPVGSDQSQSAPAPREKMMAGKMAADIPPQNKPSVGSGKLPRVTGMIATVAGALIGWYLGANLLIPVIIALLCGWTTRKLIQNKAIRDQAGPVVPLFALQVGYGLYMLGAAAITGHAQGALDALIMLGGAGWLVARPGLAPVALLATFQSWGGDH